MLILLAKWKAWRFVLGFHKVFNEKDKLNNFRKMNAPNHPTVRHVSDPI
jgi:hypothetical protein